MSVPAHIADPNPSEPFPNKRCLMQPGGIGILKTKMATLKVNELAFEYVGTLA
jgi:hypothetical protein